MIDNGPISTNLAFLSGLPAATRPALLNVQGPSSAFGMYSHHMGKDRLDVWSGGGVNTCPFPDVSYCSTLTSLRELAKRIVPLAVLQQYTELSNSYAIWLPQNQIMAAMCG